MRLHVHALKSAATCKVSGAIQAFQPGMAPDPNSSSDVY